MVSSEIRETVFIAISAILLSSLLGFVAFLMMMRSDFAAVRTAEVASAQTMADYREFNKYNGATVQGESVVSAVRDYYNTGVRIAVKDKSGNTFYAMDKYLAKDPTKQQLLDIGWLQTTFPYSSSYKAIIVYGEVDLNTVDASHPTASMGIDSNVTALVFFLQ